MRVRFIHTAATNTAWFLKAKEYDVDEIDGKEFVRAGLAEEVKEAKKADKKPDPKPEPKIEPPVKEPADKK